MIFQITRKVLYKDFAKRHGTQFISTSVPEPTCPICGVGVDKWGREVNPTVEIPANTSGNDPSPPRKGWSWRMWLLVLLFPIPFSPWWVTVICLAVFCSLVYLFTREGQNSGTESDKEAEYKQENRRRKK